MHTYMTYFIPAIWIAKTKSPRRSRTMVPQQLDGPHYVYFMEDPIKWDDLGVLLFK